VQDHFSMDVHSAEVTCRLALRGELDLASSTELEQELDRLLASGANQVVVDLRELEFMDSTGLSVLINAHQRAQQAGARLSLIKGPPQVQRLLSLTGVADRIELADSHDELRR
jgi:anti-sigma B factor antagonist